MDKRKLGTHGPAVSALGFGCMGLSDFYGPPDPATGIGVIHRALELGIDFLDTADVYGPHRNEELLGRALRGKRDLAIVATKFGIVRNADGKIVGLCSEPGYVKSACEQSLRRLGIDTIDLYYQHRVDPNTPIEATVAAMAELVAEGKVRWLGLSEAAPATLRRACAVHPITALQTELSLFSRDAEAEILPTCRELGIGFVAYSPLGRGVLGGKLKSLGDLQEDDWRRRMPRFSAENFEENLALVLRLEGMAAERHATPAQLALAWLLARPDGIVPIPGTTKVARLEENVAALSIELRPDELAALDRLAPKGVAAGERYDERGMGTVDG